MDTKAQQGYMVLADISGYTSYLARVELDHADEILTDLLEAVVGQLKTVLTLSKLEGDAVFAYAADSQIARGETLLELIEATYAAFRDRLESARRRTTCDCRACRAMPTLDLKFLAHHGSFIVQSVSGIRELVGSDVNLVHRLLKNSVAEATGWRAYALFTERVLDRLGLHPEGMHEQFENYDHLGEVRTFSLDLLPRYQSAVDARRVVVTPEEAYVKSRHEYPVPPPVVWDWLNDPVKRSRYAMEEGTVFAAAVRPGGRTGVGARTHCIHGQNVAMQETVLDWRPFEYCTVEQVFMGFTLVLTAYLEPTAGGTSMLVCIRGRAPVPRFLNRLAFTFAVTRMFPMYKLFDKMGRRIAEDMALQLPSQLAPMAAD